MITQPCPECGYWTGHGPTCTYQSRVTIRTTSTDSVPMTTDNKRDPDAVLREWDEQWADNWQHNFIGNELASALRATLAEIDRLEMRVASLKAANDSFIDIRDERDQLRAKLEKVLAERQIGESYLHHLRVKLDKVEAVIAAGRELVAESCIFYGRLRNALAAYDKEPRDGHE